MKTAVAACALLLLGTSAVAQTKDAAAVLAAMRQALGGDAALDAVTRFSVRGMATIAMRQHARAVSHEWFAVLPDSFLRVRHDTIAAPVGLDITYYDGVSGERRLRKTVARGIEFPPDPVDLLALDAAERERLATARARQVFARLVLVLFGASKTGYPLQFTLAAPQQLDGRTFDVVEATGPDGPVCRLFVDTFTHLPAIVTWMMEPTMIATTSSVVATRRGEVVAQGRQGEVSVLVPPGGPVEWSWRISDFKVRDGLNWPRRIDEIEPGGLHEELRLENYKINPKIDARRFDIK